MSRTANYKIIKRIKIDILIIKDLGPWDKYLTVTNAAEEVVKELVAQGELPEGRRLWCYDSEGVLDELKVRGGEFAGFCTVNKEEFLEDLLGAGEWHEWFYLKTKKEVI